MPARAVEGWEHVLQPLRRELAARNAFHQTLIEVLRPFRLARGAAQVLTVAAGPIRRPGGRIDHAVGLIWVSSSYSRIPPGMARKRAARGQPRDGAGDAREPAEGERRGGAGRAGRACAGALCVSAGLETP